MEGYTYLNKQRLI